MQIVLERIRHEAIPDPDPGFTLVRQPFLFRNKFVHQRVEIIVMRKLNMPADVPEKSSFIPKRRRQTAGVIVRLEQMPLSATELVKTPGGAESSGAAAKYE